MDVASIDIDSLELIVTEGDDDVEPLLEAMGLGAACGDGVDDDEIDVLLVTMTEPDTVCDRGGVSVILIDPEPVPDAVAVLLPGSVLLYVGEADVLLVPCCVFVSVLETTGEADAVLDPELVLVPATVLLPLGDAVPVFELATESVPVWVLCIVAVDLIELDTEADDDEDFDPCIDLVGDAEAV